MAAAKKTASARRAERKARLRALEAEATRLLLEWLEPLGYRPSKSGWGPGMLLDLPWGWIRLVVSVTDPGMQSMLCFVALRVEVRDERTAALKARFGVGEPLGPAPKEGWFTHCGAPRVLLQDPTPVRVHQAREPSELARVLQESRAEGGDRLVALVATWRDRRPFVEAEIAYKLASASSTHITPEDWAFLSKLAADAGDEVAAATFEQRARAAALHRSTYHLDAVTRILGTPLAPP